MRLKARKVETGDVVQNEGTWSTVEDVTILPPNPNDVIPQDVAVLTTDQGILEFGADWEILVKVS